jgi:hypothetical protein
MAKTLGPEEKYVRQVRTRTKKYHMPKIQASRIPDVKVLVKSSLE